MPAPVALKLLGGTPPGAAYAPGGAGPAMPGPVSIRVGWVSGEEKEWKRKSISKTNMAPSVKQKNAILIAPFDVGRVSENQVSAGCDLSFLSQTVADQQTAETRPTETRLGDEGSTGQTHL